jgi:glycosyltransferase involved in cell wall biosynthesis
VRVVHIAPTTFGSAGLYGGGERYPVELARALAREVDCELVAFGRQAATSREPGGPTIRTLRAAAYWQGHPAHPISPGLFTAIATADIVHTHHTRSFPSRMAALAARLQRKTIVTTDHGLRGSNWGGLLQRFFDRFLMVSAYSAKEFGSPPERTRIIYGGADPELFKPDTALAREGVLFVGRLTPHKGVDHLIEALPGDAPLRIAGSAGHDAQLPERDYPRLLRRLAHDKNVKFLGPVSDADLPLLYRHAAVFVLPSVELTRYGRVVTPSELLGLAAIEAMASGTPVICSRVGGLSEVVEDGITGFLVAPGDTSQLSERISQLLGDHELAQRMGRRAREVALERFTWRACAERCLAAYESLHRR